jgi:ubiquinone/menaquinone biosynthesis C-methylase UbiE
MSIIDEQWTTFFNDAYLRLYAPFLSKERTSQDVQGMLRILNLPPGSALLDLGCGTGRHAIALAKQGYQLTGQDLNEQFLQLAQTDAEEQEAQVQWINGDMRTIPFENAFHAIINVFSSFGLFEQEEDNFLVLQQIQQALKPGGLLILDTLQQARIFRSFSPSGVTRYPDGLIVLEERYFDLPTSRYQVNEILIFPEGERREYAHSMRIYTLTELKQLLEAAGLQVLAQYGNLDGSPLTLDSRMVIVGQKQV